MPESKDLQRASVNSQAWLYTCASVHQWWLSSRWRTITTEHQWSNKKTLYQARVAFW